MNAGPWSMVWLGGGEGEPDTDTMSRRVGSSRPRKEGRTGGRAVTYATRSGPVQTLWFRGGAALS